MSCLEIKLLVSVTMWWWTFLGARSRQPYGSCRTQPPCLCMSRISVPWFPTCKVWSVLLGFLRLEKHLWSQISMFRCKTTFSLLLEVLLLENSRPYACNKMEWGGRLGHLWHQSRVPAQSSGDVVVLSRGVALSELCQGVPSRPPHPRVSWLYLFARKLHCQTHYLTFFLRTFLCCHPRGYEMRWWRKQQGTERSHGVQWHTPQRCTRTGSWVTCLTGTIHRSPLHP